jgi:glycosyltransferase involved in cell wall biosynthesis
VLPFANYRFPKNSAVTDADRAAARNRLGLSDELLHIATFGYVDTRTKLTDLSLEIAGWLQDWGHRIHFHVVGSASDADAALLANRAKDLQLSGFTLTGYADEDAYRDYLVAIDCGLQLRVSPLLGVSGPLADLAAFGTPAVASRGLFVDVGSPANVLPLPDFVSPVTAAQAVETLLSDYPSEDIREERRRTYLREMSPRLYAQQLLAIVESQVNQDCR